MQKFNQHILGCDAEVTLAQNDEVSGRVRCAARAIILCENEMLLLRDNSLPEKTLAPVGGGIEFKESARQTIGREIKEEIGVDLPVGRFLGCYEQSFKHFSLGDLHDISFLFLVEVTKEQKQQIRSKEARYDCLWIPILGLEKVDLVPKKLAAFIPELLKIDRSDALLSIFS